MTNVVQTLSAVLLALLFASCAGEQANNLRKSGTLSTNPSPSPSTTPVELEVTVQGATSEELTADLRGTKIRIPANAVDDQQVKIIRATMRDVSASADSDAVILAGGNEVIEATLTDGDNKLILMNQIKEDIIVSRELQSSESRSDLMISDGKNHYYVKEENLKKDGGASLGLWAMLTGTQAISFRVPKDIPSEITSAKFLFWFADSSQAQYASFSAYVPADKRPPTDTTAPTVLNVSSTTANGTLGVGQSAAITVQYSEAVIVTGVPTLQLETGTVDALATYSSGSGSNTLVFTYSVVNGHTTSDLDYTNVNALSLGSGATINDAAGNVANNGLPAPGAVGSLGANKNITVITNVPVVISVTSNQTNGTYTTSQQIVIRVAFSSAVNVSGAPTLLLETGTTDRAAVLSAGTGTDTLEFTYTVQSGDASADLDYANASALALNSGSITSAEGNAAVLTLPTPGAAGSLAANKALVVDALGPTVSSVSATVANSTYGVGAQVFVSVTFSEVVTASGSPRLTLETGSTDRNATYSTGSGTNTLVFMYTVQSGDSSSDLDYVASSSLSLNGGSIIDASSNAATLTLPNPGATNSLGANKAIVIDGVNPTVSSLSSTTSNGSYKEGSVIAVTIAFSESVTVTGSPLLALETGTTDRNATYSSGSGSNSLTFNYTVQAGDTAADLDITSGTTSLDLNAGSIKDAANNDSSTALPEPGAANSLGLNKNIKIDTTAPPGLSAFNVVGGAGKTTVTLDFPASTTDYAHVVVRRATGATAPSVNCNDGTQVTDRTDFATDPYAFDDNSLAAGTYSYRACITDAAGNLTASQTQTSITVTAGSNPSWKTYNGWSVSDPVTTISIGIGQGASSIAVVAYALNKGSGNEDAFSRQFNGSAWDDPAQIDSPVESGGISGIGIVYGSANVSSFIRGKGTNCWLNSSDDLGFGASNCEGVQGPNGKFAAVSYLSMSSTPMDTPGLKIYDGSNWSSNIAMPSQMNPTAYHFDQSGTLWGVFHSETTFNQSVKSWNGSTWVDNNVDFSSGGGTLDFDSKISDSGAMAMVQTRAHAVNDYRAFVRRRSTTGTWQAEEQMATFGGVIGHIEVGVDSNGKMVAVFGPPNGAISFKTFDGTNWSGSSALLSNTTSPGEVVVCSHRSSTRMFIVWTENTGATNSTMYARVVDNGTADADSTVILEPTSEPENISGFSVACNAGGYAAIGLKRTFVSGSEHQYGAMMYIP